MLKTLFITYLLTLGLFIKGPVLFAQDPQSETVPQSETQNEAVEEIHDSQKLEKVLHDYNKDQKKVEADAEAIKAMQATGEISEEELDKGQLNDPELEKAYKKAQNVLGGMGKGGKKKDLKNIKYSEAIREALRPLQQLSESELMATLKENTKETKAAEYIARFPQIMLLAVRLIKDPEAIPALARILDDQDKLIRFGGVMIATILFGFFLRRLMAREGRSIPKALTFWFLRFLIMAGLRLGLILFFYGNELTPALRIASATLYHF